MRAENHSVRLVAYSHRHSSQLDEEYSEQIVLRVRSSDQQKALTSAAELQSSRFQLSYQVKLNLVEGIQLKQFSGM